MALRADAGVPGVDDAMSDAETAAKSADAAAGSAVQSAQLKRAIAEATSVLSTVLSALAGTAPRSSVAAAVAPNSDDALSLLSDARNAASSPLMTLLRFEARRKLLSGDIAVATLMLESCNRLEHCTPAPLRARGFGALLDHLLVQFESRVSSLRKGQLARHLMVIQGMLDEYTERLRARERATVDAFNNMQVRNLLTATLPKIRALRKYLAKRDSDAVPPGVNASLAGTGAQAAAGAGFAMGLFGWGTSAAPSTSGSGGSTNPPPGLAASPSSGSLGPSAPGGAVMAKPAAAVIPVGLGRPQPQSPAGPPSAGGTAGPVVNANGCSLPCPVNLAGDKFLCARCDERLKVNLR